MFEKLAHSTDVFLVSNLVEFSDSVDCNNGPYKASQEKGCPITDLGSWNEPNPALWLFGETKEKSLVVIQLSGGNDAMNTIVPYTNGIYHDSRSAIHLTESDVIDING